MDRSHSQRIWCGYLRSRLHSSRSFLPRRGSLFGALNEGRFMGTRERRCRIVGRRDHVGGGQRTRHAAASDLGGSFSKFMFIVSSNWNLSSRRKMVAKY